MASAFRTYLKGKATFKCTRGECGKIWTSAHSWGREDNGTTCEFCQKKAKLLDGKDEMLKLDWYRCPTANCIEWNSIHDEVGDRRQSCDECAAEVQPDGPPQERFGRHYWWKCVNSSCEKKPSWEDFSLEKQKIQRCSGCFSPGDVVMIQVTPDYLLGPRRSGPRSFPTTTGRGTGTGYVDDLPAKHNFELCDMCLDIRKQKKGMSCHRLKKVVAKVESEEGGGEVEKIVQAE